MGSLAYREDCDDDDGGCGDEDGELMGVIIALKQFNVVK